MQTKENGLDALNSPAVTCDTCQACCCRLEVLLMAGDEIPRRLTATNQWGGWVMARGDDGWCAALDRQTMRCRIYGQRPMICREFELGASECLTERATMGAPAIPLQRYGP